MCEGMQGVEEEQAFPILTLVSALSEIDVSPYPAFRLDD